MPASPFREPRGQYPAGPALSGRSPSGTAVEGLGTPPADRTARRDPDAPAVWQLAALCGSGTDLRPPLMDARRQSERSGYVRLMTPFRARLRPAVVQAGVLVPGRDR